MESEMNNTVTSDVETVNVKNNGDVTLFELAYINSRIAKLNHEKISDKQTVTALRALFAIITLIGFLIIIKVIDTYLYIGIIITVFGGVIFLASFTDAKQSKIKAEIEGLNMQKKLLENSSGNNTNRYFDSLVSINLRNLEEYYDLVKISNKKSFYASLTMSTFGVLIIAGGLIVSYFMDEFKDISYIATAAGLLVEIISGLMFYLYSKTVLQLKEYHDSLIDVQNVLLSFKLIEDTQNEQIKSEVMKQMIENLIKRK